MFCVFGALGDANASFYSRIIKIPLQKHQAMLAARRHINSETAAIGGQIKNALLEAPVLYPSISQCPRSPHLLL